MRIESQEQEQGLMPNADGVVVAGESSGIASLPNLQPQAFARTTASCEPRHDSELAPSPTRTVDHQGPECKLTPRYANRLFVIFVYL